MNYTCVAAGALGLAQICVYAGRTLPHVVMYDAGVPNRPQMRMLILMSGSRGVRFF